MGKEKSLMMNLRLRYKKWILQRRIANAIRTLSALAHGFKRMGYSRQLRKDFWRKIAFIESKADYVEHQILGSQKVNWFSLSSIKRWLVCRDIRDAIRICRRLDGALAIAGHDRGRRRDFWRRVSAHPALVVDTLKRLSSTITLHGDK